jgi:hypothetical protein
MEIRMKRAFAFAMLVATLPAAPIFAHAAEPTFKADPDVYKLIYEDDKIRIIESVRKAGVTDKLHGHPVKSVVYSISDCATRQNVDGKALDTPSKAGEARAVPVIPAHTATNTGTTDCRQLFIEEK